jgi:glycosyltransferase involved in cell wall biosynthesis
MKKIIYIGFSFTHHGEHAGYDQIRKYLNYSRYIDCQRSFNLLNSFLNKRSLVSRIYSRIFGYKLWWIEFQLILRSIFSMKNNVFHIIYGENIYKYLGYFKFSNKVILTLHQPPSYFEKRNQKSFLKSLKYVDKIIVMSQDMEDYFKEKFPHKEVLFIPHGVDIDFFKAKGAKDNQILMIGNWLRDFEFASRVFKQLESNKSKISVKVLTNKVNHHHFENNVVELLPSISDEELLQLYQKSKIVFLPLKQFTANNAMLEAGSCGCQVIVATYRENIIEETNSVVSFIEFDENKVSEKLDEVLETWSDDIEKANRNYINRIFSWNTIAIQTEDFINS